MEMDKSIIKLEVDLTPGDLYGFQKHILKKAFRPAFVIIFSIIFLDFLLMIITSEAVLSEKVIKLLMVFLVPAAIVFGLFRMVRKSSENAFKDNKLAKQTQRYEISEEYIQVESDTGHSKIRWTDLYKAEETKECFLLYISKQQAYVIAKRYFEADEQQADLLRRFMQQAPIPKKGKRSSAAILWGLLANFVIFLVVLAVVAFFNS